MPSIIFKMQHLWGFFSAKKELKDHKDKHHRITNEKMGAKT
jgi:hypothetical protein